MKNELFLKELCRIAQKAGKAILTHYEQPVDVQIKSDNSPVTEADLAAHRVIVDALRELTPDIPIISEESKSHDIADVQKPFWLVDPLDGTKSYIRRTGEFTVNIGLIEDGTPTIGIIYVPVEQMMYFAAVGFGAWRQKDGADAEVITTRAVPEDGYAAVVSHSHLDGRTTEFLTGFTVSSQVPAASSLKFCRVAEGIADVYPRFGPTMEWDSAAGHAIVVAAGGRVEKPDGSLFDYGKVEQERPLLNGPLIVWGK